MPAPITVKRYELSVKVAVGVVGAVMLTAQVPVPEHPAPDQPAKVEPVAAEAVKTTLVP